MVRQVNLYDAKTHLSQLVEDAAKGEEIVIAKNGKPLARLTRAHAAEEKPKKRVGGQWAKLMTPEERKYYGSKQFWRDWKAMDKEIERDFEQGMAEDWKEYDSQCQDTSSTPTPSSTSKETRKRFAKKRAKR